MVGFANYKMDKLGELFGIFLRHHYQADRTSYLDHFGRPLYSTEAWLFGLPMVAIALGLFELMMREQAGIARPDYFHLMPPRPPRSS